MTRVATKELERLVATASPDVFRRLSNGYVACNEHGDNNPECGRYAAHLLAVMAPALAAEVLDGRRKVAGADRALEDIVEGGLRVDVDNVSRAQDALDELRKEATK